MMINKKLEKRLFAKVRGLDQAPFVKPGAWCCYHAIKTLAATRQPSSDV